MDRDKLARQAKILREKKMARVASVAKQLRPTIKDGVVKYDNPTVVKPETRQFAAPPAPVRTVLPETRKQDVPQEIQQQKMEKIQQQINPKTQTKKGCGSCRRQQLSNRERARQAQIKKK